MAKEWRRNKAKERNIQGPNRTGTNSAGKGLVEVGTGKHDSGVLAAKLQAAKRHEGAKIPRLEIKTMGHSAGR